MAGHSSPHIATDKHLVVVATGDRKTTDDLADRLRAAVSVRTADDVEGVLDRLDDDVDVVIVDPAMAIDAVETIRTTIDRRDLDCLVARVTESPADESHGNAVVATAVSDEQLRKDVLHLANRARYRKTLETYYDTASRAVSDEGSDDPERLQARLDRLADRLDEAADELDSATLFRAALDPDRDRD